MSKVTASDGWTCRVDVVRVGADLRVRPSLGIGILIWSAGGGIIFGSGGGIIFGAGGHMGPPLHHGVRGGAVFLLSVFG